MKTLLLAIASLTLVACASNPHRAQKLDTKIEQEEKAGADVTIGVRDGEMVAQRKVMMSEELRLIQNQSYELESKVYGGERYFDNNGLWGALRNCNIQTAKHTGEMKPMSEKRTYVIPDEEYQVGTDGNKLVGLQREYLKERIQRFKQYKSVLLERQQEYEDKVQLCELALKSVSSSTVAGQ